MSTGVAVAFPRSPMVTAQVAWELQELTGGRFQVGRPRDLFSGPYADVTDDRLMFDVTPDGQRFLLARPTDAGNAPLVVVLGFDGLDYGLMRGYLEAGDLPAFRRLADQGGIVLGSAREDLNDTLDLGLAAALIVLAFLLIGLLILGLLSLMGPQEEPGI